MLFQRLAMLGVLLAFVVVILGAFTRLSDAGLGCPDWPGCYGHLDVPKSADEIQQANEAYPHRPVEAHKAWKEMVHRYFAGVLGVLIFVMAFLAIRQRRNRQQQVAVPVFLALFVVLQALLGMWTVTIKLNPTIVMLHLLGGFTTLSLLAWVALRQSGMFSEHRINMPRLNKLHMLSLFALLVVIAQIMLGGWTSANYAALACVDDFPTCHDQWWPPMDFKEAFVLWRGTEMNFEFGVLDNPARIAIQMTHRIGALVTLVVVLFLAWKLITFSGSRSLRSLGLMLLLVLLLQISLGIANVLMSLPLLVAVSHNAVAAVLLLVVVVINHAIHPKGEVL